MWKFLFVLVVSTSSTFAQEANSLADLYKRLTKGPDEVKALEIVLEKPAVQAPIVLLAGAVVAMKEKRVEDAAFLFFAAQLRGPFEIHCFSPKATGEDGFVNQMNKSSEMLGKAINPAVMADPKRFAKVHERISKYQPEIPEGYSPGYEFQERKTEQEGLEATKAKRKAFVDRIGEISDLLNDREFFAAYRAVQRYEATQGERKPSERDRNAANAAMERMRKIAEKKGVKPIL